MVTVARHENPFDQLAQEVEVRLRCCRKAHLDLLEAELAEHLNMRVFCSTDIGFTSALVAVAEVDGAIVRCVRQDAIRPATLGRCSAGNGRTCDGRSS